ncbi:MAG: iron ABC transporter permease [Bacteroidota bacterium]
MYSSNLMKKWRLPLLFGLLVCSLTGALFFGAYSMSVAEVCSALLGQAASQSDFLIWHIRLPRVLLAAFSGAGLAISGAAIQGLFRNPLADQGLIGVTSGAMLFAVLSIVFMGSLLVEFSEWIQQGIVVVFAFVGGLITTYLVYWLSRRDGKTYVMQMLLAGIAVSAFAAAITGALIYLSDDQQLRDITFWSLGSFSSSNWIQVAIVVPVVTFGIVALCRYARALNAMLLGEMEAMYLGIRVEKVKFGIISLTALIVGVCIAMSGMIGFVGLVIPHFLRLLNGTDYRHLLIHSALAGAVFMIFADTMARTIIAPAELPIGILTAMVGAPFFIWLMVRSQRERMHL